MDWELVYTPMPLRTWGIGSEAVWAKAAIKSRASNYSAYCFSQLHDRMADCLLSSKGNLEIFFVNPSI